MNPDLLSSVASRVQPNWRTVADCPPEAPAVEPEALLRCDTDTPFERGLAVIQAFDQGRESMSVSEIGQKTGIPRASVTRCLYTLQLLGFVRPSGDKRFCLTPKILTLGCDTFAAMPLPRAAQGVLNHLAEHTGESCMLMVPDDGEMLCLAQACGRFLQQSHTATGTRVPIACTASGRVILSELDPAGARDALLDAELPRYTSYTVVDRQVLQKLLQTIRVQGYARCDQELELGLCTVAVPVHGNDGEVRAALCLHAPSCRMAVEQLVSRYVVLLREAASELSLLLK